MSVDVIQAEYEQLADIANRFGQQAEANSEMISRLQQRVAQLQQGGWIGAGVDAFSREMEGEVFPALQRLTGALEQARDTTNNIKDVLKTAEDEAARLFDGQLDSVGLGSSESNGHGSNGSRDTSNGPLGRIGDFIGPFKGILGGTGNLLDPKKWDNLANVLERIVGDRRWVKQIGKIDDLIKNNNLDKLGNILEVAAFGFGVIDAMNKGESFRQALITEAGATAASMLLRKGIYAVPYVGQAMMLYDGAMLVGNLAAFGLEAAGFHDTSVTLKNFLERWDIDKHIGDLADNLYKKAAPMVEDTYNAVKDYGAGLIDDAQEVVGDTIDKVGDFADDVAEKLNPMNWF